MNREDEKQPQGLGNPEAYLPLFRITKFIKESPILQHQKDQLLRNLFVIAEEEQATASQILGNIEKVLGINIDEDLPPEERGCHIVETLKTVKENIDDGLNVLSDEITEGDKKEREKFNLEELSGLLPKTLDDTLNSLILEKLEDDKIRISDDKIRTSTVIAAVLEGLLEITWYQLDVYEKRRIIDRLLQYGISFDPDPDKV